MAMKIGVSVRGAYKGYQISVKFGAIVVFFTNNGLTPKENYC